MNLTPAWNANGVLPGATCVICRYVEPVGEMDWRYDIESDVSGEQL
jgi:hypothetical protein